MRTWIKATGLLLLLGGIACLALMAAHTSEPKYKGQPLSYWIELNLCLDRNGDGKVPGASLDAIERNKRDLNEARAAITTIGTNGLPYLTRWIRYGPPLPGTGFIPRAPRPFRFKLYRFNQERADRAQAAMQALPVLGTNAGPAIPELVRLAMKTNVVDRQLAWRAKRTLSQLGPQAFPALSNVWSNAGPRVRPL